MATPEKMLQTMHNNLQQKTAKTLNQWLAITISSPWQKHGELITLLKNQYAVTHGLANLIALETLKARAGDNIDIDPVEAQYGGAKAALKPIYSALLLAAQQLGNDVQIAPKKTYVSLRRKNQFALIQPSTKTRLDLGINLKDQAPEGALEAAGSFNAMVSHRIRLSSPDDISPDVLKWLEQAYQQAG